MNESSRQFAKRKRSDRFEPSIPSSAEQRGARIEACPEPVEGGAANAASHRKPAPFDTASTSPFDYAQGAVSAYSGCFMVLP